MPANCTCHDTPRTFYCECEVKEKVEIGINQFREGICKAVDLMADTSNKDSIKNVVRKIELPVVVGK